MCSAEATMLNHADSLYTLNEKYLFKTIMHQHCSIYMFHALLTRGSKTQTRLMLIPHNSLLNIPE